MFDNTKDEITRKFRDLKMWVSNIRDEEPNRSISYGLFFVYIYGIYEEITGFSGLGALFYEPRFFHARLIMRED